MFETDDRHVQGLGLRNVMQNCPRNPKRTLAGHCIRTKVQVELASGILESFRCQKVYGRNWTLIFDSSVRFVSVSNWAVASGSLVCDIAFARVERVEVGKSLCVR